MYIFELMNPKFHVCSITFMLEDKHILSLGMLMHVKCIHEHCSLSDHILLLLHNMLGPEHVLH
jgi:hypothetical protein